MKKNNLFIALALLLSTLAYSQIGVGTATPNLNAILDLTANNKGLLPPRIALTATTNALPLAAHVQGMIVYNTANTGDVIPGYYYNDGTKWLKIAEDTNSNWLITGNSGITATHFIGTKDSIDLVAKTNNLEKMRIYAAPSANNHIVKVTGGDALINDITVGRGKGNDSTNVAIGYEALYNNIDGSLNTATGFQALYSNTQGLENVANGYYSLYSNTTGYYNVANGVYSLSSNTEGSQNVATGYSALMMNTTGTSNIATGVYSLYGNTAGSYNIATGDRALVNNTQGSFNIATGANSLAFNSTGVGNVATGTYALASNKTGNYNIATGYSALNGNKTGNYNIATGYSALDANTGDNNVATGNYALYNNSGNNNVATGNYALFNNNNGGNNNIATGSQALFSNNSGSNNIATGSQALFFNNSGSNNIGTGNSTLYNNTIGNNNVAIGNQALYNNSTGNNNIGIGYNAQVPSDTGSNQVRIGDANISYAGIQVPWTITSDRRLKTDIKDSQLGLDFVNELRPVSYYRKDSKGAALPTNEYGFIAQEIKEALDKRGVTQETGLLFYDKTADRYQVRYNDFTAILTKAIQELKAENDTLKASNAELSKEIQAIKLRLDQITGSK